MTPRALIEPARLAGGALLRSQSDERLVDLVRAGNDRAFEAIVHRYRRALLRYCRRLLPAGRAEDAVQQAFLNAYRALRADDRAIDLRPWLYRVAHNAALNTLRAGARAEGTEELTDQVDGVERPDQAFERRERLRGCRRRRSGAAAAPARRDGAARTRGALLRADRGGAGRDRRCRARSCWAARG